MPLPPVRAVALTTVVAITGSAIFGHAADHLPETPAHPLALRVVAISSNTNMMPPAMGTLTVVSRR